MDVKHQERATCQHQFLPKPVAAEIPGFSVKV